MEEPQPDRLYQVVCAACSQLLGQVYARHADHLQLVHAPHCTASYEEWAQAKSDMEFANITGDATAITARLSD